MWRSRHLGFSFLILDWHRRYKSNFMGSSEHVQAMVLIFSRLSSLGIFPRLRMFSERNKAPCELCLQFVTAFPVASTLIHRTLACARAMLIWLAWQGWAKSACVLHTASLTTLLLNSQKPSLNRTRFPWPVMGAQADSLRRGYPAVPSPTGFAALSGLRSSNCKSYLWTYVLKLTRAPEQLISCPCY